VPSDTVHGSCELHASRLRCAAQLRSNLRPTPTISSQIRQPTFVLGQPLPKLLEELSPGNNLAGGRVGGGYGQLIRSERLIPPVVPALGSVPAAVVGDFIAHHRYQQLEQLLGLIQIVLSRSGPRSCSPRS
jgi:hypothetical protein